MVAINDSNLSSAERRVSPSASPACERDWQTRVVTWPWSFCALLMLLGLDGFSGKTSPASCRLTQDGRLEPSSGRWRSSGMGSPGESWTHSSSECPSAVVASSLSDILETGDLPPRYFLSAKACLGILRRAEKRGRKLPAPLQAALEDAVQRNNRLPSSVPTGDR